MRERRVHPALMWLIGLSLNTLAAGPLPGEDQDSPLPTLSSTPPPLDISGFEPFVRVRIEEALTELERAEGMPETTDYEMSERYGRAGMRLHAYRFHEHAEWYYRRASALAPQKPAWSYYLAGTLARLGRPGEAAEILAELHGRNIGNRRVSHAIRLRLAELRSDLGDLELAEGLFRQALLEHPACARGLAGRARIAAEQEDFAAAVSLFTQALEEAPVATRLHYELGMAYRGLGDLPAAQRHLEMAGDGVPPWHDPLQRALQDEGIGAKAIANNAKKLYRSGRFQASAQLFQEAVTINPDSSGLWINLGTALARSGQREEARRAYEQALAIEPDHPAAHTNLAILLMRDGSLEAAIEEARAGVQAAPNVASGHFVLASLLLQQQEHEDAKVHFQKGRELNPRAAAAWIGEAWVRAEQGSYDRGIALLEQAHRQLPESEVITLALARSLAASPDLSRRDGARAYDLALLATESDYMILQFDTLALAAAEQGLCAEAEMWMQRAADEVAAQGVAASSSGLLSQVEILGSGPPCRPAALDPAALYAEVLGIRPSFKAPP